MRPDWFWGMTCCTFAVTALQLGWQKPWESGLGSVISRVFCPEQDGQETTRPALQRERARPACSPAARRGRQAASSQGGSRVFRPQAWSRAQPTGVRSPQGRPALWLRENAGFCPLGRPLSFLRTCWEVEETGEMLLAGELPAGEERRSKRPQPAQER